MTWAPKNKVVDLTTVVDNLLGYIDANQSDAHKWANGGAAMPDYKKLYPNASGRLAAIFPQLLVLNQEHSAEDSETADGDLLIIRVALTLEGTMTGPNEDELVLTAKKYALALESMLANVNSASLTANANQIMHSHLMTYATVFDLIAGYGNKKASSWLQMFQTKCEFRLITSAF